jgi:GTP-binding protein
VDLLVSVPPGTEAREEASGALLGEVLKVDDRLVLARGGRGGRGNRAFLSNQNRAPREAEPGEVGEERRVVLDLKLMANVGLVGLPNAGKSTLLSRLSAARPKIADYPFTTLSPVLGVVAVDEESFVVADIPGIIEGAAAGAGLGLQFLRHVERTQVLVHVVDASGTDGGDPVTDLDTVADEVRKWNEDLPGRGRVVAATKRDVVGEDDPLPRLREAARARGLELVPVSAVTGLGLEELKRCVLRHLREARTLLGADS